MIVALCVVAVVAIAGGAAVGVIALNAQRDALRELTRLSSEQAKRDADERHVLADRLQHPEVVRPFREAAKPAEIAEPVGSFPGMDLTDLTDEEIIEEFGKDFLDAR